MANKTESSSLVFIPADKISGSFSNDTFTFNPAISLPVLQEKDENARFNTADLTAEMVFAGILFLLAYQRNHEHIDYYRELLKAARPDIRTEMTEAGILKAKNGDFAMAEEIFLALEGLDASDTITSLNLALLYDEKAESLCAAGRDNEAHEAEEYAQKYYAQTMMSEPPIPDAFFNAGYFFARTNNYLKARNCLETYVSIGTDEHKKEKAAALAKDIGTHSLDDALFAEAYQLVKSTVDDITILTEAMEKIRTFLEKHPKVWNAWFLLGWALRKMKRWTDSCEAFKTALSFGADIPDTANEIAICLIELERYDEAQTYLYDALKSDPDNTKVISNLGFLALKQGCPEDATGYFRTVLEISPDDELAAEMLKNCF